MQTLADRLPGALATLRLALVVFVLAWIFGPGELRDAVPAWAAFLVALGLEVHFLFGALGRAPDTPPNRGPQEVDRERYGYLDLLRQLEWDEDDDLAAEAEPYDRFAPVRRFLTGVGVIAALALLLWIVETRTGWDSLSTETRTAAQDRFSAEASAVAGKTVRIRCDEEGAFVGAIQHADGVATVGGDLAYLTPDRCLDLYRLAFDGEVTPSQTARSIAVLAHEAWHLRGVRDEGETECYAFQSGVELGQQLGLSEETARQLMRQQLVENASRSGETLEYRVPPECRDGGVLDLNPERTGFP